MKTFSAFITIAAMLGGAAFGQIRHDVAVKDIKVEIQQTPEFSISGTTDKKVDRRAYWVEFEAELEVKTNHPNSHIPELKAEWYAIVEDQFHYEGNKAKPTPKMLTGNVTFKNVRTKGGTAYISAYIEPDELEKLTGQEKPQDRVVIAAGLVLSGPEIAPSKLLQGATGKASESARTDKPWWELGAIPKIEDVILPKSKTPFAHLWTARYPAEKEQK